MRNELTARNEATYLGNSEEVAKKLYPEGRVKLWIHHWQPKHEAFLLQHPSVPFVVTGALSANYLLGKVFRHLKVRGTRTFVATRILSLLPLPMLALWHTQEMPTVFKNLDECPVCFQMRSAGVQLFTAVVNPLILAICCSDVVYYHGGKFHSNLKNAILPVWEHMRSKPSPYVTVTLINLVVAVACVEMQQNIVLKVLKAVREERVRRRE